MEPAEPLVSVVTATLDPGPLFERCLRSVSTQTHSRVEHVVVDGGSTDGTAEMLERSGGVRWLSEPDSGASEGMNKGIALARGSYLSFLHGDDALTPDAVSRALARFREDEELGWVYGDMLVEDPAGEFVQRSPAPLRLEHLDIEYRVPLQGSVFARWAVDRVGGFDESLDLIEDGDYAIRMVLAGVRSAYVPEVQARYAVREGAKSSRRTWSQIFEERYRMFTKLGLRRPAGMALVRMERDRGYDVIDSHLEGRRYQEASERAALEHRFMYPVFARHRLSFLATKHAPRAMRLLKRLLGRFQGRGP
jgi:GT2 family glycosyltransferase